MSVSELVSEVGGSFEGTVWVYASLGMSFCIWNRMWTLYEVCIKVRVYVCIKV